MKEILQIKHSKTRIHPCICCSCIYLRTSASLHVENVARDLQSIEVEAAESEYQEEQQPEFEVADQVADQDLEQGFTNSDTQQGKPRSII